MKKRLTEDQWMWAKTQFAMGKSLNSIAGKLGVNESTLRFKKDKEQWPVNLRDQMSGVTENIKELAKNCEPSQIPYIVDEIDTIFHLQKKVQEWSAMAVNLNMRNMKEISELTDVTERVLLTKHMKATMVDLASINNVVKNADQEADKKERKKIIILEAAK